MRWPFKNAPVWENIIGDGTLPSLKGYWSTVNMGLLSWINVGLIAGFLAKLVVPGEDSGGIVGDVVLGIVGAFIGGWLFSTVANEGVTAVDIRGIVVAFIGAVLLVLIGRAFMMHRTS